MKTMAAKQRFLIWASLICIFIWGFGYVFLIGFFPPPSASLDASQVLHLYVDNNLQLRIGIVLCICTAGFFVPWSLAVSIQMARHEEGMPIWAILQLVAGAMGALLFVMPSVFWGIAAFSVERDPAITLFAHETAFLFYVTTTSFFPFQTIPIIAVGLSKKIDTTSAFPRWLGFLMLWYLIISEAGVMAQMFKIGPFSWNGMFAFWIPFAGFSVWFPVICYMLLRAIRLQEREGQVY
jgi:hypothetical protein